MSFTPSGICWRHGPYDGVLDSCPKCAAWAKATNSLRVVFTLLRPSESLIEHIDWKPSGSLAGARDAYRA